ncbi:MAG: cytochrome b [Thermomonas sp.]|uniref:cytochrome b n=1 Tax=Thermomonas sp. TaxID=1971895 RepID=UPI001DCE489A|nr:cytochrome b [Thermomonas sp.]MBZ0086824.1 cytochrome b [Thermomonas sp.]
METVNVLTRPRYVAVVRQLHWWMALVIVAAYVLVEFHGEFPKGSAPRNAMMQGHYWAGITIFLLVWWRLAARARGGTPPIVPPLDRFSAAAAKLTHLALYAFFIVMPVLGCLTAAYEGKQVLIPFTQIALPVPVTVDKDFGHQLEDIHGTIGTLFYWVIGLHVLAALWHHLFKRDNVLERML